MGTWSLPQPEPETSSAKPERFVWPPRSADRVPFLSTSAAPPDGGRGSENGWDTAAAPASPIPQAKTLTEHWSEIERTWLDVVAPPLPERMVLEGWSPDTLADYCPRCALSVGRDGLRDDLCEACRAGEVARPPWQRIFRLGEYAPPLNQWIGEVKFTRWRRLGRDLGRLLGDALTPEIAAARETGAIPQGPPLIVPVPMPGLRRLMRGIDHTVTIARGVADRVGGRVVQPLRRDLRPSQTRVAPSSRAANVANSIHPRAAWLRPRLDGRLVIVLDDVTTTGSTLRGACRAAAQCMRIEREGGVPSGGESPRKPGVIWAAVLARTPPDSHDIPGEVGE